ncbi:hypothetical protein BD324DRAFT_120107 [Kockovaella imperatae]|uniref:Uncharacterized protein n=1 Tax=Kockovaella imperatae TaxID=4999 RepID=A0A1Y1UC91_9TREE|nr:hypothetical protein BD324DRAFT_120107 [Kockovaella imperatae]ORX35144.1 hypothetical protein BD324DRAFT_120107 [Kockovaella imperatae]
MLSFLPSWHTVSERESSRVNKVAPFLPSTSSVRYKPLSSAELYAAVPRPLATIATIHHPSHPNDKLPYSGKFETGKQGVSHPNPPRSCHSIHQPQPLLLVDRFATCVCLCIIRTCEGPFLVLIHLIRLPQSTNQPTTSSKEENGGDTAKNYSRPIASREVTHTTSIFKTLLFTGTSHILCLSLSLCDENAGKGGGTSG